MNDWSARAMQMHEMKLNLGPAKGKDFATTLGPWLVTMDELASMKIDTPNGATYDLEMTCTLNGERVSLGNVKDMSWTFAQIIERASYGVTLHPGDVIGSGTCGTGCFLELNGSKVYNPPLWVKEGDTVVCSIDALGSLSNSIEVQRLCLAYSSPVVPASLDLISAKHSLRMDIMLFAWTISSRDHLKILLI